MQTSKMKKLLLSILLMVSSNIAFAQNQKETKHCQQLVLNTFSYTDSNPLYQPETDSLNLSFRFALLQRNVAISKMNHQSEIESLFKKIYNYSSCEYDDSPDYRRFKMRRAICFAAIALLSAPDKALTFLEYAKVSLVGSIDNPDDEFLENQYIGLLTLEIMLKLEANSLSRYDLDKLHNYLTQKKDRIDEKNFEQADVLNKNLRQNLAQPN